MAMAGPTDLQSDAQRRVAAEIRRAMAEQGLTQVELSRRTGVPQPRISSLISGDRGKFPRELLRVLDALGLKLAATPIKPSTEHAIAREED